MKQRKGRELRVVYDTIYSPRVDESLLDVGAGANLFVSFLSSSTPSGGRFG